MAPHRWRIESAEQTGGTLEAYAGESAEDLPAASYAAMMVAYSALFGSALLAGSRRRRLPNAISPADIILLGIATHQLSRILTRDRITAPLRMPFTRYEGKSGAGEVNEQPRGKGLRRAIGGLLTCQYCIGPWIAACFAAALIKRPRETRVVGSVLATVTVSDFLHQLYAWARRSSA